MTALYHYYTCDHGHAAIGESGYLHPLTALSDDPRVALHEAARWVWLTDLSSPLRDALGLTSVILRCDRTVHRYRVTQEVHSAVPWREVRRLMSPDQREGLEGAYGARPAPWWVTRQPVAVTYDPMQGAVMIP